MIMENYNKEFSKILDLVAQSSEETNDDASLKDLYTAKKEKLNLSDRQIQKLLGMDKKTLDPILNATAKQINFINIIKLAHFLGITINKLTKIYLPDMSVDQIGEIERARIGSYLIEYFDIAALTKMKFLESGASSKEMSEKLVQFLNLDSIFSYSKNIPESVFIRTKRNSSDLMRSFWVVSALKQFELIDNPYDYNRDELIELMPKIRPFTRDEEHGLTKVLKALYAVGITVIYQPSIEKLQVRGATMSVNNKPCIVLSDLNKNYPTLWFALLHDLHHVLYDFEEIDKRVYHITSGEGDLFLMNEERADDFAREYLLSETRFKFAKGYITSNLHIEKLAKEWGVHPSIIYSFYCFDTKEWAFYKKYIPNMEVALQLLNTHPFEQDSLLESARRIKEVIAI
ncbi:MAG: pirin [Candidatus Cloacimonetes bacterium]|nr:pirin [Candidatus Cloacimonadota bacterium]